MLSYCLQPPLVPTVSNGVKTVRHTYLIKIKIQYLANIPSGEIRNFFRSSKKIKKVTLKKFWRYCYSIYFKNHYNFIDFIFVWI